MPKKTAPKSKLQEALDAQVAIQASVNRAARSITRILSPFDQEQRNAVLGLVVHAMGKADKAETTLPNPDQPVPAATPGTDAGY